MKIGIFGGCFNPPHKMHKNIAKSLIKKKYLDKVIFVPTGNNYSKPELVDITERIEMLNVMFKNNSNISVSDISKSDCYQYTFQVLDYFQSNYPEDKIYFICGTDNLEKFETWRNYEYILNKYNLLVIKRNNDNIEQIIEKYARYKEKICVANIPQNPVSSTQIREYILKDNFELLNGYLDKEILEYIQEKRLYKKDEHMNNIEKLVKILSTNNKTIAAMESCTGGSLANAITNIPGASCVLKYSAVTYSDEYKIKMGVSKNLIETYGVYSKEVAKNMSKVISDFSNSDYGIGITGKINEFAFVCIYIKEKNEYLSYRLELNKSNRIGNKNYIVLFVIDTLFKIIAFAN